MPLRLDPEPTAASVDDHKVPAGIDGLTRALIWLIAALLILLPILTNEHKSKDSRLTDFLVFYGAAQIAAHSASDLYDPKVQTEVYQRIFPLPGGPSAHGYFSYPPFVALLYAPMASLPFWTAYRVNQAISAVLYLLALMLLLRRFLRHDRQLATVMAPFALAYFPFIYNTWVTGQLSVLGFAAIAVALSEVKLGNLFCSGLALSICAYKPSLLILLLPMLLFSRQFRILLGFATGALALAVTAGLVYGWHIWMAYDHFLRYSFGDMEHLRPLPQYSDLTAFFSLLFGSGSGPRIAMLCTLAVLPFLVMTWRRYQVRPDLVWACTLTWTLILGPYVPIYDTVLLIASIIVTASSHSVRSSRLLPAGLLIIFACSWISEETALFLHLQLLTVVIAAFGTLQLWACFQSTQEPKVSAVES
ncbi:MAG TPA: glycosyltransferase family 87 protein [Bryobacteraceae bacterium]